MPARSHGSSRFLSGANKVSTTESDVTSNVTHPGILPQVSAPAVSPARSKSGGKEQGAASSRDGSGRARGLSFVPFNRILTVTQIVCDRSSIFNTCMHQNHLCMLGFGNCSCSACSTRISLCRFFLMKDDAWASRAPMEDHNDGEAKRDLLRANLDVQQLKVRNSRRAKWLVAVPRMS